jgi:hypothetical protein
MEVTINISPELEAWLQAEATRKGLDARGYIVDTLRERLQASRQMAHLSLDEADLLQAINQGPSQQSWQRYRELLEKRNAETLKASEQVELIAISDRIEEANARRVECLAKLAQLRQVSLEQLMEDLGIRANPHG